MQIQYAMSTPPVSVPPMATLEDAARHMSDAGVGALPVVDDERVVGMVTDRDLVVRAMACGLSPGSRVEAVMSTDPVTVTTDTAITAAMHTMRSIEARHLPVVADPSHGTGRRDMVAPMAKASMAAGADAILIEVHPNADKAVSDAAQTLYLEQFEKLMDELRVIAQAVGRSL